MRSMSRFLLGACLALGLSGLAFAETPETTSSIEPGEFTHFAELRLDQQFELSLASAAEGRLHALAGPTTMTCSHVLTVAELETCVVTAEGTPRSAVPASSGTSGKRIRTSATAISIFRSPSAKKETPTTGTSCAWKR